MRGKSPLHFTVLVLFTAIMVVAIGVLPACSLTSASQAPKAMPSAFGASPSSSTPLFNRADDEGFFWGLPRGTRISNGPLDVFSDLAEGAAEATSNVADAMVGIKEDVERAVADWQAEREAAEAHAREVIESAELVPTTKTLEYSNKRTDPLQLVKCSDPQVTVTCPGWIDLSEIGEKEVDYTLSYDGQRANRTVTFKVRDTKAPQIKLVYGEKSIEVGARFSPSANIGSVEDPVDGKLSRVDTAPKAKASSVGAKSLYDFGWYSIDGSVDTSTPGVYPITVKASDKHGNTESKTFEVTVVEPEPVEESWPVEEPGPAAHAYVLNTNTMKFHTPGCRAVKQMNDSNRWDVEMTRDEVINMGYESCGICHP